MSRAILYTLNEIIKAHPNYIEDTQRQGNNFDAELVDYLFSRLTTEELLEPIIEVHHEHLQIKTNVPGLIERNTIYRFDKDKENAQQKSYSIWQDILKKNAPQVMNQAMFLIEQNKHVESVGFNAIYALHDLDKWYEQDKQTPMPLNEKEQEVVIENLLTGKDRYKVFSHTLKDKPEFVEHIMEMVVKYYHSIRKNLKKDERSMLATIFGSKNFLKFLNQSYNQNVKDLFPEHLAFDIVKKADVKENGSEVPYLVSSLMPMQPPEKWVNDSKTAMNLFNNLIKRASGYSNSEIENFIKSGSMNAKSVNRYHQSSEEWIRRLDYLGPTLSTLSWSDMQKQVWYAAIFQSQNANLLLKSLQYIDLPENKNTIVFKNWIMEKPKWNNEEDLNYSELVTKFHKEQLEQKLGVSDANVKKHKI